jgi:acrylyl-CoA reductase (NADPH)
LTTRFRALVAPAPSSPASLVQFEESALEGDVLIAVECSSLNYKDGLALRAAAPVVRRFPLVCGIDLAGRVLESADPSIGVGDEVIVTGCGLGEEHHGGLGELARVRHEWCVPLPPGRTASEAMALGTAGVTAALGLLALERAEATSDGLPVLVTGAGGGVGALAVALFARSGRSVVASTGRPELADRLVALGASEVIGRIGEVAPRPLEKERFAHVLDVVGGSTLASAIAQTRHGGVIAACGLAGSPDLATTVYPFILRGVTLSGINSVHLDAPTRRVVWERLFGALDAALLASLTTEIGLAEAPEAAGRLLSGQVFGRTVVDVRS